MTALQLAVPRDETRIVGYGNTCDVVLEQPLGAQYEEEGAAHVASIFYDYEKRRFELTVCHKKHVGTVFLNGLRIYVCLQEVYFRSGSTLIIRGQELQVFANDSENLFPDPSSRGGVPLSSGKTTLGQTTAVPPFLPSCGDTTAHPAEPVCSGRRHRADLFSQTSPDNKWMGVPQSKPTEVEALELSALKSPIINTFDHRHESIQSFPTRVLFDAPSHSPARQKHLHRRDRDSSSLIYEPIQTVSSTLTMSLLECEELPSALQDPPSTDSPSLTCASAEVDPRISTMSLWRYDEDRGALHDLVSRSSIESLASAVQRCASSHPSAQLVLSEDPRVVETDAVPPLFSHEQPGTAGMDVHDEADGASRNQEVGLGRALSIDPLAVEMPSDTLNLIQLLPLSSFSLPSKLLFGKTLASGLLRPSGLLDSGRRATKASLRDAALHILSLLESGYQRETAVFELTAAERSALFDSFHHLLPDLAGQYRSSGPLIHLSSPIFVCGDMGGSYADLDIIVNNLCIFGRTLLTTQLLCLGNFVGDCPHSVAVVLTLLTLRVLHPSMVHLLRGDAEFLCDGDHKPRPAFYKRCQHFFGDQLGGRFWSSCRDLFRELPIAAVIDGDVFACHGSVPTNQSPALSTPLSSQSRVWSGTGDIFGVGAREVDYPLWHNGPGPRFDSLSAPARGAGHDDSSLRMVRGPVCNRPIPQTITTDLGVNLFDRSTELVVNSQFFTEEHLLAFLKRHKCRALMRGYMHGGGGGLPIRFGGRLVSLCSNTLLTVKSRFAGGCVLSSGRMRLVFWRVPRRHPSVEDRSAMSFWEDPVGNIPTSSKANSPVNPSSMPHSDACQAVRGVAVAFRHGSSFCDIG